MGKRVAIVGGSGGIGRGLVNSLVHSGFAEVLHATYYSTPPHAAEGSVEWQRVDVSDESSVRDWSGGLGDLDWLINAAGVLHTPKTGPEKSLADLRPEFFLQNMSVNAMSSLLLAKHLEGAFSHGRSAVFAAISARVGSIQDNRLGGWYSYRASKAALNMGIKTLSVEWRRRLPKVSVVALHPGTTDTALSQPFQRNVPRDRLFSVDYTAACLVQVLENLKPSDSGGFLSYKGEQLPW